MITPDTLAQSIIEYNQCSSFDIDQLMITSQKLASIIDCIDVDKKVFIECIGLSLMKKLTLVTHWSDFGEYGK